MAYADRLNPLAERTSFSQVNLVQIDAMKFSWAAYVLHMACSRAANSGGGG